MEKKEDLKGVVFIGSKPFMNYIQAVNMQFSQSDKVTVRARGKFISRAVDIAEVMRNKFESKTEAINIGSETFEKEGKEIRVSIIDIILTKK